MCFGVLGIDARAHDLRRVNDAETTIRRHDDELRILGKKQQVIGRDHPQDAPVGKVKFKRFEWSGIAQFLKRFQRHNDRNLLRSAVAVNATLPTCRASYAWDGVAEGRHFGAMEKNIVEGVY